MPITAITGPRLDRRGSTLDGRLQEHPFITKALKFCSAAVRHLIVLLLLTALWWSHTHNLDVEAHINRLTAENQRLNTVYASTTERSVETQERSVANQARSQTNATEITRLKSRVSKVEDTLDRNNIH